MNIDLGHQLVEVNRSGCDFPFVKLIGRCCVSGDTYKTEALSLHSLARWRRKEGPIGEFFPNLTATDSIFLQLGLGPKTFDKVITQIVETKGSELTDQQLADAVIILVRKIALTMEREARENLEISDNSNNFFDMLDKLRTSASVREAPRGTCNN